MIDRLTFCREGLVNGAGEKLDICVDIPEGGRFRKVVILAHGFGTDLHERGLFDELAEELNKHCIAVVRPSYSGFGSSEGKSQSKGLSTMAEDLRTVVRCVRDSVGDDMKVDVLGFSLGAIVAASIADSLIEGKVILVNPRASGLYEGLKDYFGQKEGVFLDEYGESVLSRSDGSTTLLGPIFWRDLKEANPARLIRELHREKGRRVRIISAANDEVLGPEAYKAARSLVTDFTLLPGGHNFEGKFRRGFIHAVIAALA